MPAPLPATAPPTLPWAGDFLRVHAALEPDAAAAEEVLRLLGLDAPASAEGAAAPRRPTDPGPARLPPHDEPRPQPPPDASAAIAREQAGAGTPCFSALHALRGPDKAEPPPWFEQQPALAMAPATTTTAPASLLNRLQRRSILGFALARHAADGPPDIGAIVAQLSLGRPLTRWPRLRQRTLRHGVQVLADRARWMAPFAADVEHLVDYLRRLLPADRLQVTLMHGRPPSDLRSRLPGSTVLALTDFGAGYDFLGAPPAGAAAWIACARAVERSGRRFRALVPYRTDRLPDALRGQVKWIHWAETTTIGAVQRALRNERPAEAARDAQARHEAVADLATAVAPALRVEPALLRAARQRLLPQLPPETEADLWCSGLVSTAGVAGLTLKPELARGLAHRRLADDEPPVAMADALELIAAHHRNQPESVRLEEALGRLVLEAADTPEAIEHLLRPALKALAGPADQAAAVAAWVPAWWSRTPEAIREAPAARALALGASLRLGTGAWLGPQAPRPPGSRLAWLVQAPADAGLPWTVTLRRRDDGGRSLHFMLEGAGSHVAHALRLPRQEPLWVQVGSANDTASGLVALHHGAQLDAGAGDGPVEFGTLDGRRWRVEALDGTSGVEASLAIVNLAPVNAAPGKFARKRAEESLAVAVADDLLVVAAPLRGVERGALEGRTLTCRLMARSDSFGAIVIGQLAAGGPDRLLLRFSRRHPAGSQLLRLDLSSRATPSQQDAPNATELHLAHGSEELVVPVASTAAWALESEDGPRSALDLLTAEASVVRRARWTCMLVVDDASLERPLLAALHKRLADWRVVVWRDNAARKDLGADRIDADVTVIVGRPARAARPLREWWPDESRRAAPTALLWASMSADPTRLHRGFDASLRDRLPIESWLRSAASDRPDADAVAEEIVHWRSRASSPPVTLPAVVRSGISLLSADARRALARRLDGAGKTPGLFHVPLSGEPALEEPVVLASPSQSEPMLLFIHGEAATTAGSFGDLWRDERTLARLRSAFGERAWAFEYRSVSQGPIANAFALASALPDGARLRIVCHGAGGLIGELLCAGAREGASTPYADQAAPLLFSPAREPDHAALLNQLDRLLVDKRFAIERIVRVASPMRGVAGMFTGTKRIVGMARLLGQLRMALGQLFVSTQLDTLVTDADISPGLASLAPNAGAVSLVNGGLLEQRIASSVPLAIVAGIHEPSGLLGLVGRWAGGWFLGSDDRNDLYVDLESNFGGFERTSGVDHFVATGGDINHFRLFAHDATREAIVDALLDDLRAFRHAASLDEARAAWDLGPRAVS